MMLMYVRTSLHHRTLQLQDEITELKLKLQEKEKELAEVKEQLGITPLVEFKESLSQGWKVLGEKWNEMKESDRYVDVWWTLYVPVV